MILESVKTDDELNKDQVMTYNQRYRTKRLLGQGSFGRVLLVLDKIDKDL